MSDLVLGFDVGTQGTKAVLVDLESAAVVARAARAYGLIEGLAPGAAEQHPDTWLEALRGATADLFRDRPSDRARVRGIGVSGQQHGLVLLDEGGRVLRPAKLWCDTSTAREAAELSDRLGRHVPAGFTASKIAWVRRNEPDTWDRTRTVLLPHDYVNFVLTGVRVSEPGDASGTGYFDVAARTFDPRAMEAIAPELAERVPPIVLPPAIIGELDARGAELLGLPRGVAVSSGSGDNMMSALGSGATEPGVFVVSLGTSATVFTRADAPAVDPEGLIASFCDATGAFLPLLCVMNATGVFEEVRRAFGLDHAELTRRAARVEPGARGVTFLPYLAGERVPDLPNATGTIFGLRAGSLDAAVLYRAAIEGVCLNIAWGVERMRALGLSVSRARVVGGAAHNALVCQVLADALGASLTRPEEPESAALGAAIHVAWALSRARGEPSTARFSAAPFVETDGATGAAPVFEPHDAPRYRALLDDFRALATRLHAGP